MLETSFKSKLPRGWSYPIGAQVLSEYLDGIDGAVDRPFYFSDYPIWTSRHRQLRDQGGPYPIVEVSYSEPWGERKPERLKWSVTINPVPSDKAASVRESVACFGLPKIREWLRRTRVVDEKQGRGFCSLLYDETRERLLFRSRLNDTDDPVEIEMLSAEGIPESG